MRGQTARVEPPTETLANGVLTIRFPSVAAGDVGAMNEYAQTNEELDGVWPPILPHSSAERSVYDWLQGEQRTVRRPAKNNAPFDKLLD